MSNIIVDYNAPIQDGTEVVFRSPVDCSQITGLKVNYIGGSQEFMLADAHGNNVGDIDHLFAENAVVKVILDVTTGMAFVQNPDTNSYLEYRFGLLADSIVEEATGSPIVLKDSSNRELRVLNLYGKTTQNGTPTPDAPVAMNSAGSDGSVEVKVMGKNLYNHELNYGFKNGYFTATKTTTGYSLTGATLSGNFILLILGSLAELGGKQIKLSMDMNGNGDVTMVICAFDYSNRSVLYEKNGVYTIPHASEYPDGYIVTIRLRGDQNLDETAVVTYNNIQAEFGTVATAYEPYKEPQTHTVPTPNGLPGIGDFCDEIDFARGVYVKRIKERVLNGTENFSGTASSNTFSLYMEGTDVAVDNSNILLSCCNYYTTMSWTELYKIKGSETAMGVAISGAFIRMVDNVNFPTHDVTAFKQFLADRYAEGNPVIVQYVLKEANWEETELTAEQLEAYANCNLHTYKPNTTITSDAGMKVEYVADTKAYIDNKFTELQNAILASGANV